MSSDNECPRKKARVAQKRSTRSPTSASPSSHLTESSDSRPCTSINSATSTPTPTASTYSSTDSPNPSESTYGVHEVDEYRCELVMPLGGAARRECIAKLLGNSTAEKSKVTFVIEPPDDYPGFVPPSPFSRRDSTFSVSAEQISDWLASFAAEDCRVIRRIFKIRELKSKKWGYVHTIFIRLSIHVSDEKTEEILRQAAWELVNVPEPRNALPGPPEPPIAFPKFKKLFSIPGSFGSTYVTAPSVDRLTKFMDLNLRSCPIDDINSKMTIIDFDSHVSLRVYDYDESTKVVPKIAWKYDRFVRTFFKSNDKKKMEELNGLNYKREMLGILFAAGIERVMDNVLDAIDDKVLLYWLTSDVCNFHDAANVYQLSEGKRLSALFHLFQNPRHLPTMVETWSKDIVPAMRNNALISSIEPLKKFMFKPVTNPATKDFTAPVLDLPLRVAESFFVKKYDDPDPPPATNNLSFYEKTLPEAPGITVQLPEFEDLNEKIRRFSHIWAYFSPFYPEALADRFICAEPKTEYMDRISGSDELNWLFNSYEPLMPCFCKYELSGLRIHRNYFNVLSHLSDPYINTLIETTSTEICFNEYLDNAIDPFTYDAGCPYLPDDNGEKKNPTQLNIERVEFLVAADRLKDARIRLCEYVDLLLPFEKLVVAGKDYLPSAGDNYVQRPSRAPFDYPCTYDNASYVLAENRLSDTQDFILPNSPYDRDSSCFVHPNTVDYLNFLVLQVTLERHKHNNRDQLARSFLEKLFLFDMRALYYIEIFRLVRMPDRCLTSANIEQITKMDLEHNQFMTNVLHLLRAVDALRRRDFSMMAKEIQRYNFGERYTGNKCEPFLQCKSLDPSFYFNGENVITVTKISVYMTACFYHVGGEHALALEIFEQIDNQPAVGSELLNRKQLIPMIRDEAQIALMNPNRQKITMDFWNQPDCLEYEYNSKRNIRISQEKVRFLCMYEFGEDPDNPMHIDDYRFNMEYRRRYNIIKYVGFQAAITEMPSQDEHSWGSRFAGLIRMPMFTEETFVAWQLAVILSESSRIAHGFRQIMTMPTCPFELDVIPDVYDFECVEGKIVNAINNAYELASLGEYYGLQKLRNLQKAYEKSPVGTHHIPIAIHCIEFNRLFFEDSPLAFEEIEALEKLSPFEALLRSVPALVRHRRAIPRTTFGRCYKVMNLYEQYDSWLNYRLRFAIVEFILHIHEDNVPEAWAVLRYGLKQIDQKLPFDVGALAFYLRRRQAAFYLMLDEVDLAATVLDDLLRVYERDGHQLGSELEVGVFLYWAFQIKKNLWYVYPDDAPSCQYEYLIEMLALSLIRVKRFPLAYKWILLEAAENVYRPDFAEHSSTVISSFREQVSSEIEKYFNVSLEKTGQPLRSIERLQTKLGVPWYLF